MDALAIIPATRAPNGNLAKGSRSFAGRPLVAHSIEQARTARRVTWTVVATDDRETARLARDWGAETVVLPAAHAADGDPPELVLLHTLDHLERSGVAPALVVTLPIASPLRTPEMIDAAIDHMLRCGGDSLVSVCACREALWVEDENGHTDPLDPDPEPGVGRTRGRRRFVENGAIVVTRTALLRQTGKQLEGRVVLYEIPERHGLRLTSDEDWLIGEALHRRLWCAQGTAKLRGIGLLVFDFDGVMTDNRVLVLDDGREAVLCNRGDGMGLDLLKATGLPMAVLSKEGNPVVTARCRKLGIHCVQGIGDKLPVLKSLAQDLGLALDAVAFMGNDVNDLACMRAAAVAIAPVDAHAAVLREADLITTAPGGFGAVREVADLLLAAKDDGPNKRETVP